jgi:Transposase DNA-binding/Transposase Tn5 dimerisation domain
MEYSIVDELAGCDFGDMRLNRRAIKVATGFSQRPNLSIPTACGGRSETKAAYRFFDNENVKPQGIISPHCLRSIERVSQCEVAVLAQDTTEIDLTNPEQQVVGAGVMASEKMFGAFMHPLFALRDDGVPLGTVSMTYWTRPAIDKSKTQEQKDNERKKIPIEEKESFRWIEGLREARKVAEQCPNTKIVVVADSEADIYELFAEERSTSHQRNVELIVRGCHDRCTDSEQGKILATVRASGPKYDCQVKVGARKAKISTETRARRTSRKPRTANCQVFACSVILQPPDRTGVKLPPVKINVVLVEEQDPPEGDEPIQWILVTTLPVDSETDIRNVVKYYCLRWEIEIFFKTLKSGCRIEERRFETLEREMNCVAMYMIVAWRIMLMCRLGRECPDMTCEAVFETSEWQAIYKVTQRKDPPSSPPTLNEMIRMVATLGGFIDRKRNEPGTQTLWIGMQRMYDIANCWEIFGPGKRLLN